MNREDITHELIGKIFLPGSWKLAAFRRAASLKRDADLMMWLDSL
jgi:hypothetical protein